MATAEARLFFPYNPYVPAEPQYPYIFPPAFADVQAERMHHNWMMTEKAQELLSLRQELPPELLNWLFQQVTGLPFKVRDTGPSKIPLTSQRVEYAYATVATPDIVALTASPAKKQKGFYGVESSVEGVGILENWGWTIPERTELEELIANAQVDPDDPYGKSNFGGGLPPIPLIIAFHNNVYVPAINSTLDWKDQTIVTIHQYPSAGGHQLHRNTVIDLYLGNKEREVIISNFSKEKRHEGMFFTYGSQEAIWRMCKHLVDQEGATPENPVELVITDPAYPGLFLAAEEFIKSGVLKFRIVPLSEDGEIDLQALDEALESRRAKAIYLSEGNPIPKQFSNIEAVAKLLTDKHKDKLVFEDRAYVDLGASREEALFHLLPGRVVAFETFSKKGAPFRAGIVYSNMDLSSFVYIRDNMLKGQFNQMLGYSGLISGTVAAILECDKLDGAYTKHIETVKEYYERQRKLYIDTYIKALNTAFGEGQYNLNDKVIAGDMMFMFGWRKTPVNAHDYNRIGAKGLKIFSLPGSNCTASTKHVIDPSDENSRTLFGMRQNYTWIHPLAMQLGIFKDVLLEVVLTVGMNEQEKQTAVEKLQAEITRLNGNKPRPEVEAFVRTVRENNWSYSTEK